MEPLVENKKKIRWGVILLCGMILTVVAASVGMWLFLSADEPIPERYFVELRLLGQSSVTVEYGEVFDDPGAEAVGYGTVEDLQRKAVEVTVSGEVDSNKLGSYTVTYQAEYMGVEQSVTRTVSVVDTEAPEIQLEEDPDAYTLPGQPYEEEGFTASDLCDGDLTASVERLELDGTVTYTVEDSSGNRAQVTRQIRYDDPEPPELSLLGEQTVKIWTGDPWSDPGCTARDNVDGDITEQITVSGEVDRYTAGTYILTYQVTDSYQNTASADRVVIVEKIPVADTVEPEGKVIYLTFDDGPWDDTPRLLAILEKYQAKATFFVVNTKHISLLKDIAAAGHSIGIHSKTHKYQNIYSGEEAFFEDFYAMRDIILEQTGVNTVLMRFPGGSSNTVSKKYSIGIMARLAKAVESLGFRYFDWNVDSNDAGGAKSSDEVYRNVIAGILEQKNPVVLMHDTFSYSVDAVERILQWGQENGYRFEALTETSPECHHMTIKN